MSKKAIQERWDAIMCEGAIPFTEKEKLDRLDLKMDLIFDILKGMSK